MIFTDHSYKFNMETFNMAAVSYYYVLNYINLKEQLFILWQ